LADDRDELLTPSLTQSALRELPPGRKPWRLGSQFYVSFFGGPLAAAAVGFMNADRLELPRDRRAAIVAAGLLGFALAIALLLTVDSEWTRPRFLLAVTGVLAYAVVHRLQHAADRRYALGRDDESAYDSLWQAGLAIVLVAGLASAAVLVTLE
jgi:uncharacterized membrane protein